MIYRSGDSVLVLGITGKQGTFWAEKMMACGTRVVAGVNPKRAGEMHLGLPVFASASTATAEIPCDTAVLFVPPAAAKDAAIDAIAAGIRCLVMLTEHIPVHDVMTILAHARRAGTTVVGPNTAGIVTPGEGFVGIMPGHNANIFQPGRVGVVSRSGSLGTLVCLNLTRAGLGQSAFIGVGGDPLLGTTTREAVEALEADAHTDAIVMVGEIGGNMEEDVAAHAHQFRKPIVAFLAGAAAPHGKRMGHAGAIVTGSAGTYASKRAALEGAGFLVASTPNEIAGMVSRALGL